MSPTNPDCREVVTVTHNMQQAEQTRDALSKAIYARIFDFLVEVSALAVVTRNAQNQNRSAHNKAIYVRLIVKVFAPSNLESQYTNVSCKIF
jgi:hypothetical protein